MVDFKAHNYYSEEGKKTMKTNTATATATTTVAAALDCNKIRKNKETKNVHKIDLKYILLHYL